MQSSGVQGSGFVVGGLGFIATTPKDGGERQWAQQTGHPAQLLLAHRSHSHRESARAREREGD